MGGQQAPASQSQFAPSPSYSDSFSSSLANNFWPGQGYAGAAQSPYLPIVAPLFQSYSPMIDSLTQSMQTGPAAVQKPPMQPGQDGGKGTSNLVKGIDPVMSSTMGK